MTRKRIGKKDARAWEFSCAGFRQTKKAKINGNLENRQEEVKESDREEKTRRKGRRKKRRKGRRKTEEEEEEIMKKRLVMYGQRR